MNLIPNKKVICDCLCKASERNRDIIVLCSDSRGSASMSTFFEKYPLQSIEVGIAEQNLVSIAAGMASCGKKPFVFSPASFLSCRAYEQIKVDCSYSDNKVSLIGISGGVSYGALGMTHHSLQDIACMCAIPNMRVYLPSDRYQTKYLINSLIEETLSPSYIRVGRNPVEDIYDENYVFDGKAIVHSFGSCNQIVIIACGEMVISAIEAAKILQEKGIDVVVLDMFCLKPFDDETTLSICKDAKLVVTVEEHAPYGGLGALVSQVLASRLPKKILQLSLPDEPVITGNSKEVFEYYQLNGVGIANRLMSDVNMV